MGPFLRIAKRDFDHVTHNVIALVVCIGMVVIPSFYAWFNIAGSWDPYGNTANLKVALANSDEGYKSSLLPVQINIGERTVTELSASEKVGYVVTDEEDAVEGVQSGKYYAAIVIPKDFSRKMLTVLTDDSKKPEVIYYNNAKRNAIASIVTSKASTAVKETIDETFSATVTEVGAATLSQFGDYLNDAEFQALASKLGEAAEKSSGSMRDAASTLDTYSSLVGSMRSISSSATGVADQSLQSVLDAGGTLRQTASGVRDLDSGINGATDAVNSALQKSSSSFDDVESALDDAFDTAGSKSDALSDRLGQVKDVVDGKRAELQALDDQINSQDQIIRTLHDRQEAGSVAYERTDEYILQIDGLKSDVEDAIQRLQALSDSIQQTRNDLSTYKGDAEEARTKLKALAADGKSAVSKVSDSYEGDLKGSLGTLASSIDDAAATADQVSGELKDAVSSLSAATSSADKNLQGAQDSLDSASAKLREGADKLDDLRARISAALASGDLDTLRAILSADPSALAAFISSPVQVDRTAVFPVENNGSAMAPFYTTLCLWVGGVVLAALVRCEPSERAMRETGAKPRHAYFGRLVFFLAIGFMQTLVALLGDLYFLGIQCQHPILFLLTGTLASTVFINVIYALTYSFGDVGKAIAVVLMVIQVAGSGGTFPMQMLPDAFQAVYPWLPFVHSENAMRAAMFGIYGNDYAIEMAKLACFLLPALLLGLLLRKPVVRLNHWIEEKLESTKLM